MVAKRQLRFYWLLDSSGSMSVDGKIEAVNEALASSTEIIRDAAKNNARGDLLIYAVQFNSEASWVSADFANGVRGEDFEWKTPLQADGETYMGKAIEMVAESLKTLPNNGFKPVIVLMTDGQPTDNFDTAFQKLLDTGWGKNANRLSIAIGEDADMATLQKFCSPEVKPLKANTIADLKKYIRWASQVKTTDKPTAVPLPTPGPDVAPPPVPGGAAAAPAAADDTFDF